MNHLIHCHSRNFNRDVCSVRTYIDTVLTYLIASQATFTFVHSILAFLKDCFLRIAGFFCSRYRLSFYNIMSKDCFYCNLSITDCFYDRSSTFSTVTCYINTFYACFHCLVVDAGFSALINCNTVCFVEFSRNLLANCNDYGVSRNFFCFACFCHTCTSGSIHVAKFHLLAEKFTVFQRYRRKEFFELYALFQDFQ